MRTPRHRVLSGSAVLLSGLGLVTLINFAYNIAVARFLGATAFGHTTAVYTLLILISSVTLSFQILTAKIVAQQASEAAQAAVYRGLHWRGWASGITVALLLLVFRHAVTDYLNLPDPLLIVMLAVGTAFYVPLGARRGYIQGVCNFGLLAQNLVLEGVFRLAGSLLLILLGAGVQGVIAANAAAVTITYFLARPELRTSADSVPDVPVAFRESLQAAVFFAGQVVINNCDIVVVKHFFPSELAGIYAAVAMVGRVVFAFSWAVVSSMFPIVAETQHRKQREDYDVLGTSMLLVLAICLTFVVGLSLAPGEIWTWLFGNHFVTAGVANFSSLLVLYAASTGVYALSVVVISYEMSRKIANTGWVQLVISGAVIAGIYAFHSSLAQVIWVQIVMMVLLLLCVAVPFVVSWARHSATEADIPAGFIQLRRRASEDEVIAEFLKNDFRCPEFQEYQETVGRLVNAPDFRNDAENKVRRALLFVRHGALWRELPHSTEWFEAEIHRDDLHRIRVFPRAHWRKLAVGDFSITQVARRIEDKRYRDRTPEAFRAKIEDLRDHLMMEDEASLAGAVLLIGLNESGPFTVLDGNHRLAAAILAAPDAVDRLRFFCGLSPQMRQCCWYQTNVTTLLRYARNMVRHVVHDPEQELARLLQSSGG